MSLINKLVQKGIKKIEAESKRFDQEFENVTSQIEFTRKKMDQWKSERRIIRNK